MTEWLTRSVIDAARGLEPVDIIYRNAEIFNPFTCSWEHSDLAIMKGRVVGIGVSYRGRIDRDLSGAYIVPGLIDAHVHIESSLLLPHEYARLVAAHGTTTVIADPHEIANVTGILGIEFMLTAREHVPLDIFFMLPSCVPATPLDIGGATLNARDLARFIGRDGILGLGEMMNVRGVLGGDHEVMEKLSLSDIRDGHAPLLSGSDLNAYILAGMQSDHECTQKGEAEEKLRRGMYIFLREGSTERNIAELIPLVNSCNASRCCFATDDCHADILMEQGHIDRCIRKAIDCGLEPELALRMATLSAAERYGLSDRGALAPGRLADFCIVDDPRTFLVKKTFKQGIEVGITAPPRAAVLPPTIHCLTPSLDEIRLKGMGKARIIGLVPHQIITESRRFEITEKDVPDFDRDILKAVVCSRYRPKSFGVGLVRGFSMKKGAIASSVSHDAHNIIAVGVSDDEILRAIDRVIRMQGAMVVVIGKEQTCLPLDCGGLMSTLPYEQVVSLLQKLHEATERMGGINDPFMYLSFLTLTVIPALRLTERGVFDVCEFRDVPLFFE